MKKERQDSLLLKIAIDMENMSPILGREFLVANDVAADECYDLCAAIAFAIRGYVRMSNTDKAKIMFREILEDFHHKS